MLWFFDSVATQAELGAKVPVSERELCLGAARNKLLSYAAMCSLSKVSLKDPEVVGTPGFLAVVSDAKAVKGRIEVLADAILSAKTEIKSENLAASNRGWWEQIPYFNLDDVKTDRIEVIRLVFRALLILGEKMSSEDKGDRANTDELCVVQMMEQAQTALRELGAWSARFTKLVSLGDPPDTCGEKGRLVAVHNVAHQIKEMARRGAFRDAVFPSIRREGLEARCAEMYRRITEAADVSSEGDAGEEGGGEDCDSFTVGDNSSGESLEGSCFQNGRN